jgi:uncharacterized membrane protein
MTLILLGALLIIVGVVYMAIQPMIRGRLSRVRRVTPARPGNTLEPQAPTRGFGLSSNWPGLLMIGIGTVLLLASAVF